MTFLAAGLLFFGLTGPLSSVHVAVLSTLAVRPACQSRWDAAMGPMLGDPLYDPYGGLDAESLPQGTVFGGAAPLAKPAK